MDERDQEGSHGDFDASNVVVSQSVKDTREEDSGLCDGFVEESKRLEPEQQKRGKNIFYDTPLSEEAGVWIPVLVPPMLEPDHEEWSRGLSFNGGYFPEGDMGWNQILDEDKELTMWDVIYFFCSGYRGFQLGKWCKLPTWDWQSTCSEATRQS